MEINRLSRIKYLFEAAQKLESHKRKAFLRAECGSDETLFKEVRSLLDSLDHTRDFLEEPLTLFESRVSEYVDPFIGRQTGNYVIDGEAGIGGMGVVYTGRRNDKAFKQKVAIKILKHGFTSQYHLRRFQLERQTLANLQHPNIARLLDGGTTSDGLPYLVMEYIDGKPVTDYCTDNNLDLSQILELFGKICQAVQYAHQHLVIHRDIKPGNILVTKKGIPKLLDFGIAKLINEDLTEPDAKLTITGMWHFTPEYTSPEQIKGEKITTASDIYSLGVLLYKLMTGFLPYRIRSSAPAAITKAVTTANILKPSEKVTQFGETSQDENIDQRKKGISAGNISLQKLSRYLKGDLDNIILKAMHQNPERRYSSVEQFAEDIRKHLVDLPVIASKDTAGYRIAKFVERHKAGVVISALFGIFLVFSISMILWQMDKTTKQRDIAQQETRKSEAVNQFLQEMLASPDPTERGRDIKVYDVLEKASDEVELKFKNQPEVAAAIHSTIGNTFTNLGEYPEAIQHLLKALTLNKTLYGEMSKETAGSLHDLALYDHWVGKLKAADSLYSKADSIYENIIKRPIQPMAVNLNDYATLKNDFGQFDEARQFFERALNISEVNLGYNSFDVASMMNNLAMTLDYLKDFADAEKYYLESKNIYTDLVGENRPEIATIDNNLAFLQEEQGNFSGAVKYFEKSLQLKIALLGKDHPKVGLALSNLGAMHFKMKQYDRAEKYLNQARAQFKRSLKPDHIWFGLCYYWLGRTYLAKHQYVQAEANLRKSLAIREKAFPAGHYLIHLTRGYLGICLLYQNKYAEAEKYLLDGFNKYRNALGEQNENNRTFAEKLKTLYEKQGNVAESKHYEQIARSIASSE